MLVLNRFRLNFKGPCGPRGAWDFRVALEVMSVEGIPSCYLFDDTLSQLWIAVVTTFRILKPWRTSMVPFLLKVMDAECG